MTAEDHRTTTETTRRIDPTKEDHAIASRVARKIGTLFSHRITAPDGAKITLIGTTQRSMLLAQRLDDAITRPSCVWCDGDRYTSRFTRHA